MALGQSPPVFYGLLLVKMGFMQGFLKATPTCYEQAEGTKALFWENR